VPYRFVHAADIHLDSPLRSLALRDPGLATLIGTATRQALARIVDLCLDEQVDALLLAGDLYDGEQTSMKTARFLAEQMHRLDEAGIGVFVIRGNHDAISRITRELTLPKNVKVFSGRAEAVAIDRPRGALPVTIHGVSFADPRAPESLLPRYRPPTEGAANIGLMHTSLDGAPGHDPYAPCRLADLQSHGFRYWALGHIHRRAIVPGACTVVMPGIPQGRDINEAGAKSCTLVTIADDGTVHVEERPTATAQFERIDIRLAAADDWHAVLDAIAHALGAARAATAAEHLIARLRLTGTTPLAWRLRADPDLLKAESDLRAGATGKTWIEALEIACTPPESTAPISGVPVTELRQLIQSDILPAGACAEEIRTIAEELRGQLPPELRALLGADQAGMDARLAELLAEGVDDVLARLQSSPGGGR
jgi:DNA repair exonuclease SbcCD nuclease subunit